MALELHISGPGLTTTRRLSSGDASFVLGRDAECDVCLPDPERTVSRRHLELRVQGDELHFHVLSSVNGIGMAFGEAPPGARGVLPRGESLVVGDYVVRASVVDADEAPAIAAANDEDPFEDWGFNSTFGPSSTQGEALHAGALEAGDVSSFFEGLGVDPGAVNKGELDAMGRLVRMLVFGVLDLHSTVTGVKQELRSEDRTMVATRNNNPLKTDAPSDVKLRFLFGGRIAAAGHVTAERAMREVLAELVAHNTASAAATRAAVEGTLRDLAPGTLKAKLLGDSAMKLFEGTRAWDAFGKWHDEQSADMKQWVQRQLDRHFTEAYLRESLRIRRETKK